MTAAELQAEIRGYENTIRRRNDTIAARDRRIEQLTKALLDLRNEVSDGIGDDGNEELKFGIHHGPVVAADAALADKAVTR